MSRPVVDQARAVALAARVRQGEEARDALSRLIRPIAVSEARHLSNQFPLLSRADIESAIAEKTLKGMVTWKPGAGMSVTSYLKRCARNAVYDLARKGRPDAALKRAKSLLNGTKWEGLTLQALRRSYGQWYWQATGDLLGTATLMRHTVEMAEREYLQTDQTVRRNLLAKARPKVRQKRTG